MYVSFRSFFIVIPCSILLQSEQGILLSHVITYMQYRLYEAYIIERITEGTFLCIYTSVVEKYVVSSNGSTCLQQAMCTLFIPRYAHRDTLNIRTQLIHATSPYTAIHVPQASHGTK